MGQIKGQNEYERWQKGEDLTRKETMLANCFACNGFEEGRVDCKGVGSCPLYKYFSYKGKKQSFEELLADKESSDTLL